MAKVYAMIANGTEEAECLNVVDILRRGGVQTVLVSAEAGCEVRTSHDVRITADMQVNDVDFSDADCIFLPGGMPGSKHLAACAPLVQALHTADTQGKRIAAICAAPGVVLGTHDLLHGRSYTCYPGFEHASGVYSTQGVVTDGTLTTARGLGFAIDLGLELVRLLCGEMVCELTKERIQYR